MLKEKSIMKKIMKKMLSSAVVTVLSTAILTACGSSSSAPAGSDTPASSSSNTQTAAGESSVAAGTTEGNVEFEPIKLAYATNAVDETFVTMKTALDEVVGPALNIEFMYSEALSDAGAMTTFIENAYASGCDGVIVDLANSIDQAAAVCNDLGIYYVGISSADSVENMDMPYYVSVVGSGAEGYGESYAEALKSVVDDGEEHNVLIMSGAACYGATSFIEGTAGSLRALQDVYGLTYTQDTNTLATTSTQIDAENDKGVKITIFPGMQDLATSVSPLLQTGGYDVLVGTSNIYDSMGVAVDEVEKALNMDIKFITRSTFSDAVTAAFNSKDSQGSNVIDAMVCPGTFERIAAPIMLRNAIDGYVDNMRGDGRCSYVSDNRPLAVTSLDAYNALSGEKMPYAFMTTDDILSLCSKVNPDVTWEDINAFGKDLTAENIMKKFQ